MHHVTVTRFIFFFSLIACINVHADLKIGVVAPRTYAESAARWAPLARYLSAALNEQVQITPLLGSQLIPSTDSGAFDAYLSHSSHAVYLMEKVGGRALATLNTQAGSRFGGVMIAKKDSNIRAAKDVKGKRVSTSTKQSAGAYHFPLYHLVTHGVQEADLALVMELKKQDNSLLALENGVVDVAFMRTGVFEQMVAEGAVNPENYVVVDQQKTEDFPQVHSTALYPEWLFVVVPSKVDDTKSEKLKTILLGLPPDSDAAIRANIKGFIEPSDLSSVKTMLRDLKIPPFDK